MIAYLKENGVNAVFHYVPLRSSFAGKKFGRFFEKDNFTTKESERLLRLPMFYRLSFEDIDIICKLIKLFYKRL